MSTTQDDARKAELLQALYDLIEECEEEVAEEEAKAKASGKDAMSQAPAAQNQWGRFGAKPAQAALPPQDVTPRKGKHPLLQAQENVKKKDG